MNGNGNGNGHKWSKEIALVLYFLVLRVLKYLFHKTSSNRTKAQSEQEGKSMVMQGVMELFKRILLMLKLAAADAVDGTLTGAKVILFTNALVVNKNTLLAGLDVATFTGYATSTAVTWGTPFVSGDTTQYTMTGDAKTFTCSAGTEEEVIEGYALISADDPPRS